MKTEKKIGKGLWEFIAERKTLGTLTERPFNGYLNL